MTDPPVRRRWRSAPRLRSGDSPIAPLTSPRQMRDRRAVPGVAGMGGLARLSKTRSADISQISLAGSRYAQPSSVSNRITSLVVASPETRVDPATTGLWLRSDVATPATRVGNGRADMLSASPRARRKLQRSESSANPERAHSSGETSERDRSKKWPIEKRVKRISRNSGRT
jgi:hypothetical protein